MKKLLSTTLTLLFSVMLFANENNITYKQSCSKNIKNVDINLSYEKLEIIETSGNEFTIQIECNNKRKQPRVEWDDDTIHIKSVSHFSSIADRCKVELSIPKDYMFNNFNVSSSSGTVNIENLKSDDFEITSTSGEININNIYAQDDGKIKSTSGSINIDNISADTVEINSTSGSINIENCEAVEAKFESTSGTIKLNNFDGEYIESDTTSGSQKYSNCFCDYFNLESTSGSITLELTEAPLASSSIESTSGSIKLYIPKEKSFDLVYETNSGSLNDNFNDNKFSPRHEYRNSYFGGGPEIKVETSSGSLEIDE